MLLFREKCCCIHDAIWFYITSECYYYDLGMESGDISSTQITVSSGNGEGRLNGNAWKPASSDVNPSITLSFPNKIRLDKITLTGSSKKYYQSVAIMYTVNGVVDTLLPQSGVVSVFLNFTYSVK